MGKIFGKVIVLFALLLPVMVCARAMRDLCEAWKNTGRVDKLATLAMSFAEVKKLLGVEEFLKLRERL